MNPVFSAFDRDCMARAIDIARYGRYTTRYNPNVGCVIAKNGRIIGEGWHKVFGGPHAEVNALRGLREDAVGATAYVTLEPCSHYGKTPPCANALIQAGVARVVIAMTDPNPLVAGKGIQLLQSAGIAVSAGLMSEQAAALNRDYLHRLTTGRPLVSIRRTVASNAGAEMDSPHVLWVGDDAPVDELRQWRAQAGAIVACAEVAHADVTGLLIRHDELPSDVLPHVNVDTFSAPVRILIDKTGRLGCHGIDTGSASAPVYWVTADEAPPVDPAELNGGAHWVLPFDEHGVNLPELMKRIAALPVNSLWIEADGLADTPDALAAITGAAYT
ncbi:bifunctional diaminohydroxyphosphoribosylaminopyrimidine deaminase/5-amino-6-(5-phosphoribosylamino)uracil reductase RibD [Dickeya fangzhongdai]|uniref:bifunctional diaminohydroxyphosphoribosylaminopyrimidine deaminase/5-amino-6-(5-phosphoribosylamino)uracil reductase RibD n=1 Tax=Dickeya fangzhongdai TaxID=1778540 RepID=UPI00068AED17|nr:bifunctional diaminohydroxyphosphoribosylaminopyrimidine deaminase/5-amino-6-(5-phosphoribosylamino)uracil reductase RibD [Dickeya fangzhongdai]